MSLVRVTNSGVSGVIDPTGREVIRLPVQGAVAESVRVPVGPGDSFYTRHGDVFAVLCIAVCIVALGVQRLGLSPQ